MHLALLACIACIGHVTAAITDTISTVRCPPIATSSAIESVTCLEDVHVMDCSGPLVEGAIAVIVCSKNHYAGNESAMAALCRSDGTWTNSSVTCKKPECGRQNAVNVTVDGEQVQDGEMPWNINIYKKKDSGWSYACAGTLITSTHVITSGYCAWYWQTRYLRLAARKLIADFNTTEPNAQWRGVHAMYKHEQYATGRDASNNIAILVADGKFLLNSFVMPACIDWSSQLPAPTASDVLLSAAYKKGTNDPSLELVTSQGYSIVQDRSSCNTSAVYYRRRYVIDSHFCARTVNNQTCRFRSGASLTQSYKTSEGVRHYLTGVKSAWLNKKEGGGCATDILVAFTDLTQYLPWIRDHSLV